MNIEYVSNNTAFLTITLVSISLFLLKKTRKHKELDKIKSAQLERYSVIINAEDEALRLVKEATESANETSLSAKKLFPHVRKTVK
ncbi:hypothetical protein [Pantoea agglomerans]|jgi:hypothetical protein|uniref:hypothetical protein n=1 Tax=Enterobacter agglomerans TaxID=549 RepID=UPI0016548332|nr:hypothetical protein [Pantoea agglomerans]